MSKIVIFRLLLVIIGVTAGITAILLVLSGISLVLKICKREFKS